MRTYIKVTDRELALEQPNSGTWLGAEDALWRLFEVKLKELGPFARRAEQSQWRAFEGTWRLAVDVPDDPIGLLLP